MPMWGVAKSRTVLEINPMEYTRAKLDSERRGLQRLQATTAQLPSPPRTIAARKMSDNYAEAVRVGLGDLKKAYVELIGSPRALPTHIDPLHRLSLDLRDVAKPAGFSDLAQAAGTLAQLCKDTDKAARHPELIKLHLDSMRSLAEQATRGEPDGRSGQLLEALKLAVNSVING
jgi:hypothetical protein